MLLGVYVQIAEFILQQVRQKKSKDCIIKPNLNKKEDLNVLILGKKDFELNLKRKLFFFKFLLCNNKNVLLKNKSFFVVVYLASKTLC